MGEALSGADALGCEDCAGCSEGCVAGVVPHPTRSVTRMVINKQAPKILFIVLLLLICEFLLISVYRDIQLKSILF